MSCFGFLRMTKLKLTYLFLFLLIFCQAQNPFTRVRSELNLHSSLVLLDSCADKKFYNDSVLFYKALIHLKKAEYKMANKTCKALAKDYPDFKEVHYLNGMLFFSNQNYGKSVTEFNLALQANPKNAKALYNRSVAFGLMEEYLSAIDDLDACIQINPNYMLAYYSRGYWYEFTGNYTEAAKDYEKTIQLDGSNYDAYLGLAYSYQQLGNPIKACEVLTKAIIEGSQVAAEIKEIFCK